MLILSMAAATVFFLIFAFLFLSADDNLVKAILVCLKETEAENIKNYQAELKLLVENMKRTGDLDDKKKITEGKRLKNKLKESKKRYEALGQGKIGVLDVVPVAGYRLMQLLGWDGTNEAIKKLKQKCIQFKERKEAVNYTYYLLGSLFGYVLLGLCCFFLVTGLSLAAGMGTRSLVAGGAALVVFGLLGYLPYDNVNATTKKREEEIENQFPQAVSKLALLTVAGLEVGQAWRLSCQSETGVLYDEMRRVLVDLDHNVSPMEAYGKFISRCNNAYTTKLGTAIMQNLSKGNSEIVKLFCTLNEESWMEHKHNARRKGELIQSKLLIPTLLMFVGIIVLVIVPVMSGFSF